MRTCRQVKNTAGKRLSQQGKAKSKKKPELKDKSPEKSHKHTEQVEKKQLENKQNGKSWKTEKISDAETKN